VHGVLLGDGPLPHPAEAQKWMARAREEMDKSPQPHDDRTAKITWTRRVTLTFLRDEAEALVGKEGTPQTKSANELRNPNK
jgi:hypothetical protein